MATVQFNRLNVFVPVLLASFFLINFALSIQIDANVLDSYCNVVFRFNTSNDEKNKVERVHEACEKIAFQTDENSEDDSKKLDHDCFSKCFFEKMEVFFKNGSYNPTAVPNLYEAFSNATTNYISKISGFHETCAVTTAEKVKLLEKNGTAITECTFFGEFDICIGERLYDSLFEGLGNATLNVCGDSKPEVINTIMI